MLDRWSSIKRWLASALGEAPGAYFMAALWGSTGLMTLAILGDFVALVYGGIARFNPALRPASLLLPLALLATLGHYLVTRPAPRARRVKLAGLTLVAALLAYLAPSNLLSLLRLFGLAVPEPVAHLVAGVWPPTALAAIFSLLLTQQSRSPVGLRLIALGMLAGGMISIVLAYPAYGLIFNTFNLGVTYTGSAFNVVTIIASFVALLIMLAVGPAAVLWIQPQSRWGCLIISASAGALTGGAVFGLIGVPLGGAWAQSPLYGFVISQAGYENSEWVLKLALAVLNVFPVALGLLWGCVGGGALVSGITGLLTPHRVRPVPAANSAEVLYEMVTALGATLVMALVSIASIVVLDALPASIQTIFDAYGVVPRWPTTWLQPAFAVQYLLILTAGQLLGLAAVYGGYRPLAARGLRAVTSLETALYSLALIGGGLHLSLWALMKPLYASPLLLAFMVINVGLSLEIFLALRWVKRHVDSVEITTADSSAFTGWTAAGMVVGVLVGVVMFQFIGLSVSLVLVSLPFIEPLANLGTPPGVPWLEQTLFNPLFIIAPAGFAVLTVWSLGSGFSMSAVSLSRKSFRSFGIIQTLRSRLAAVWKRIPRWMVDSLAVTLALIIAWTTREVLTVVLVSTLAALVVLHGRWERPSWFVVLMSFIVGLLGVAGLTLGGVFTDARPARLMYLLLGPASLLALRALTAYTPANQHTRTRLTAFIGLAVVVGLLSYVNQTQILRQGGISRYDGEQWEAFDSANSALGVGLNYGLYQDSQGQLWFGSGAIAATYDAQSDSWQRYLLRSISNGESLTAFTDAAVDTRTSFLEDSQGRLWVASGNTFGQLDTTLTTATDYVREPGMFVAGPNLGILADCDQGMARLWDTDGNLMTLFLDSNGRSIRWFDFDSSVDGTRLVTTDQTQTAQVWDTNTGQLIMQLEGHTDTVNSAVFSPDDARIVTASDDKTVRVWDAHTGNLLMTINNTVQVNLAFFNPAGTQVIAAGGIIASGTTIDTRLWDVQTGELAATLEDSGSVQWVNFSPDGTRLVTESATQAAQLWDANTGHRIATLEGHSAEFNPDGAQIVTASNDGPVRLWDGQTGRLVATLEDRTARASHAQFSPDGARILTASLDGTVRLWQADTGQLLTTFERNVGRVRWAGFTPDGTRIVIDGTIWDANSGQLVATLGDLDNANVRIVSAGFTRDGRIIDIGCVSKDGYEMLQLNTPITDMTLDKDGNLWLATAGDGVYRINTSRQLADMAWEHFSSANIANLSSTIYGLYVDQAGNLWTVTDKGLTIFDGVGWGRPLGSTPLSQSAEVTFVEDGTGQLWAGAIGGLYQWNGGAWTTASEWPEGLDVTALIEDSTGHLWAGTPQGALRFDGSTWKTLVPDVTVTTLVEDPNGKMWVGAQSGLFRFDPTTGKTDSFTSANSSLATDTIRDLLVDMDGNIWASTFTVEQIPGSPWLGLAAAVLFFGYLSVQTYRNYDRAPESRARRLNRQIEESPDSLYPTVYTLLANAPDASRTLTQLADYRAKADDAVSAEAIRAIVALTTESRINLAANLNRSAAALEADAARAGTLPALHRLLSNGLAVRLISDLTRLELSVDPGPEAGNVAIRTREVTVNGLPVFVRTGLAEAWRALEKVGVVLRKYQEVDTAADRLSFLADALNAAEAAETAAQSIKSPEGASMVAIAAQWRAIVTYEINLISGRADLRLELRTRQARRAEQITVVLRLQNVGRATAENVSVTLQPGEGFTLDGESGVTLDRLPSGRSQPIEFTLGPAQSESARIACRVTWDDRMGAGNTMEFADALRFYEVTEAFTRIPNPYIVGHPVKSPAMFQGRADVFEFIRDNLSGPTQDRTIVLHGQRRTGKTSILYQLVQGRLGSGFVSVLIDMQEVALLINHTADFLNEVAYQLARALRKAGLKLEPPDEAAFATAPTRTFSRFLDTVEDTLGERKAVLIFDEFELIEGKIAEGKLEADLLNYFRSLIQHRQRLVFIFTGTHRLEEMSHDYWSILFNLALYRRVSFLAPAEAVKLIRQPVAGALDVDELAVEKIIALTRGHAYFTQLICWALVNHCNAHERNYATLNDVNDAVQEILASGEAHFAYIWQQAGALERLVLAGLAHTLRPGKDWARPAEVLETLASAGSGRMDQAALAEALDRLLPRLFEGVNTALNLETESFWLLDQDTDELVCRFAIGPGADAVRQVSVPVGRGLIGACVANQESILVADAQHDSRTNRNVQDPASLVTHSILSVPIMLEGQPLGAIQAINKRNGELFNNDDLNRLRQAADSAAPAIRAALQAANLQENYNLTLDALSAALDRLARQEVLESAPEGALRYRFQVEVLRQWVEATKSVTTLMERWLRGLP